jgi:hypothetical protein
MRGVSCCLALLFLLAQAVGARAQGLAGDLGLRYNYQRANASVGECGCFSLEGAALDASWKSAFLTRHLGLPHSAAFSLAVDVSGVHTDQVGSANYGLSMTTFTAGK